MTQTVLETLFTRRVLVPGDTLVVNKQRLQTEFPISEATVRDRREFEFWRCRITDQSPETHQVRYLLDDERYGLASLATHIGEQLTDDDSYLNITSQEHYWRHPSFENRTLWDLLITDVRTDRGPTDADSSP